MSPSESDAVTSARGLCSRNYLRATIVLSGARVILGMGTHARIALIRVLPLESDNGAYYETVIGPRRLVVAFLPHPNSRRPETEKTLQYNLTTQQLESIRY
jgi:uracil-DNA glycosylase